MYFEGPFCEGLRKQRIGGGNALHISVGRAAARMWEAYNQKIKAEGKKNSMIFSSVLRMGRNQKEPFKTKQGCKG